MHDTRAHTTPALAARLAPPYDGDLSPVPSWRWDALAGAGGLRSTANDMGRLMQSLTCDDTFAEAFAIASREHGPHQGLGWTISGGGDVLEISGAVSGYRSALFLARHEGVGLFVVTNSANVVFPEISRALFARARGQDPDVPRPPPSRQLNARALDAVAGTYRLGPEALVFDHGDGKLSVTVPEGETVRLYAETETDFYARLSRARFEFRKDAAGAVDSVLYRHAAGHRRYRRE